MTTTDARKRNRDMADAHATARARDARVEESFEERAERYGLDWDVVAHLMSEQPTRRAYRTRTQAIDPETGTFTPLTQEPDMTDQPEPYDFHDEAHRALLNDDLSKGWQAGLHALLAIHDTLAEIRDRLPERTEVKVAPFDPDLVAANIAALKHELETPMRGHGECCEPAPTDDLPGEPVEPDEALARVIFGDAFGSHEGLRLAQLDVALMAREHIEAEEAENHPVGCGQMIRDVRDGDGFVTTIDGVMIAKTDSWNDLTERAKKAEAEAKHLRERLDALRADLSPGGLIWTVDAALRRDDERAAKVPAP